MVVVNLHACGLSPLSNCSFDTPARHKPALNKRTLHLLSVRQSKWLTEHVAHEYCITNIENPSIIIINFTIFKMDTNDSLYADLDSKKVNSGWNQRRKAIQTRKRGWIRRLKSDISLGKVEAKATSRNENEEEGGQGGMFPPIHIDLKKPPHPKMEYISNLGFDVDHLSQSVLCMVCFSYVSIGNERVVCQHCPVVIHGYCIKNPLDYTSREYKESSSYSEAVMPTSYDITWTCAFCIHDVKKKNHEAEQKWKKEMVNHAFKASVVKLQSFFRMFPQKMRFKQQVSSAKVMSV